jgi:streptogramin lyase
MIDKTDVAANIQVYLNPPKGKQKMKLKKLNTAGFSHDIFMVAFVLVFAIVGAGYLVASHADTACPVSGPVSSSCPPIKEHAIPIASSSPQDITTGPDNNLWFTESADYANNIGKITPTGVVTSIPIPTKKSCPFGIATRKIDNTVWFTEKCKQKIGKITSNGAITEYKLSRGSGPAFITLGRDGNMWFTESSGNKIGKITTQGNVTEYNVPTADSFPQGISSDSAGNMWFTESSGNKIGKITTQGNVTEYNVPTAKAAPFGISFGTDGNLWFTETNNIGRITPKGVIVEYKLPLTNSYAHDIIVSPDDAMWFTESSGNKIGRISVSGAITEFNVPTGGSYPAGITLNPFGNLWFTEANSGKIGELVLTR